MNDPERLFDTDAPEPMKAMIAAARAELPADGALEKTLTLVAAGGAGASLLAASHAAELAAAHGSSVSLTIAKWAGVGVIAGATTLAAVELPEKFSAAPNDAVGVTGVVRPAPINAPPPKAANVAAPAEQLAPEPPPTPAVQPTSSSRARSAPSPEPRQPATSAAAAPSDPLVQEVLLLDSARAALGAGQLAAAEARLLEHRSRFPGGKLTPEALYLQLEIRERRGDHAGAQQIARELVTRFPNTPPASRAQKLLGRAIP